MSKAGLIGRIAVQEGMISRDQLRHATREQGRQPDMRLGELLVDLGYIDEGQLGALLAAQARSTESPRPPRRPTPPPVKRSVPDGVKLASIALKRVPAAQFLSEPPPAADDDHRTDTAEARNWLLGLLGDANTSGASDVLMLPDQPVRLRRFGRVHDFTTGPVSANGTKRLLMQALTDEAVMELEMHGEVSAMFEDPSVGRYRVHVHRELAGMAGVFHRTQISDAQPSFEDLGLPNWLAGLTNFSHGMILVTGPAGSGRSTTMNALIQLISEERRDHIVVVETPLEVRPQPDRRSVAVVTQLEVHRHCSSAAEALRDAPRMDVDVICVDELPTDAMHAAIQAAVTEQLVIATLRAPSSTRAIELLIDSYPVEDRRPARSLIADSVRAVLSQRLVPAISHDGSEEVGMVLALEVVQIDDEIREIIRTGDLSQISAHVQSGGARASFLLDASLNDLVQAQRITLDSARAFARHPGKFADGGGR